MKIVKPPYPLRLLYSGLVWRLSKSNNSIYLTFDDGPIPELTPWVLDTLSHYDAKATFFCVGENVLKNPEIYTRIIEEGHSVGNHTMNHLNGWKTKNPDYLKNIELCSQHVKSRLFRPPYGKIKRSQLKSIYLKNHFKIIMWDVLSYDFDSNTSKETCLHNVISNSKNGSIIVFHDNKKAEQNLRFTLPATLDFFKKKGYSFKPLN